MKNLIFFLIGLAIILLLALGVYNVVLLFLSLNPSVLASLIAGSATIMVSVGSVVIAKHLEHKALIKQELREKKVPIYNKIIKFIYKVVFAKTLNKKPLSEQEMAKAMIDFVEELTIWGADDVVNAFCKFRSQKADAENSEENINIVFAVEDLLLAIRKDLGHSNFGLSRGKLLGLFVTDINERMEK